MNQTTSRNVRSPSRKAYRVGRKNKPFTMAKTKVIYTGAGKPSTTGKPSGGKRTTIVPATSPVKK